MFNHERLLNCANMIGTESRGAVVAQPNRFPGVPALQTLIAFHGDLLLRCDCTAGSRLSCGKPVPRAVAGIAD